jgi:hypothetical protein
MSEHLVPLGGTGWSVWRDVLLRGTGFPIDGLARFAAPDCASAADGFLAGEIDEQLFDKEFERTVAASATTCRELAADPLFREAITWQSATALSALDGLLRSGDRRNSKRLQRERMIVRYWQRYCAKNETIGFFGPSVWATVDPDAAGIAARPGPDLVRGRAVDFEYWALAVLARQLADDPQVRRWLPPAPQPHLTLAGREVLQPAQRPLPVSPAEATALSHCDGRVPAVTVIAALVADGVVRTEDDGHLLLERLAERGLLRWHADLPQGPEAERALRALLAGIGDPAIRQRAGAGLDRLAAARDEVTAAAGDPDRLAVALSGLAGEFTAITGAQPYRRAGQAYAGRGLCVEDTVRDVDVVIGGRLLDEIAEPMALVLTAARWLTAELARAYGTALRELYEDLAAGGDQVLLADLWYLAQGPLFGTGERPVDAVAAEFSRRWATVFGLADGTSAELAAAAFPAERPGCRPAGCTARTC